MLGLYETEGEELGDVDGYFVGSVGISSSVGFFVGAVVSLGPFELLGALGALVFLLCFGFFPAFGLLESSDLIVSGLTIGIRSLFLAIPSPEATSLRGYVCFDVLPSLPPPSPPPPLPFGLPPLESFLFAVLHSVGLGVGS